MSPEQRAELESIVTAHSPSVVAGERERLLFESARELGRRQANRQATRKSIAAAAVSCGLTLLVSWAVMPRANWRHGTPAHDAMVGSILADKTVSPQTPTANSVADDDLPRIAAADSGVSSTRRSRFEQNILTPISWNARWELSQMGNSEPDLADPEAAEWDALINAADTRRSESVPLRAGAPIDHF